MLDVKLSKHIAKGKKNQFQQNWNFFEIRFLENIFALEQLFDGRGGGGGEQQAQRKRQKENPEKKV